MTVTRRTFLFSGALGIAALAAARYWPRTREPAPASLHSLDVDGAVIMTAITPVMLADALPQQPAQHDAAVREMVISIDRAIGGLSPQQVGELGHLFALLSLPPVRWALTRSARAWDDATPNEIAAFLDRLRDSKVGILRAAYDALHQLVFAAWYGNPRAWPAIGYAGPPVLR